LGIDEGLAIVAIDGVIVDFFLSSDVMDWCVAANNG
jgi:hypothetical protein